MSLSSQLLIAIAAALVATFMAVYFRLVEQPLLLTLVLVAACCAAPLLAARSSDAPLEPAQAATGGREEGEIKWFNVSKGFGFIRRQNGEEIFVHFRSVRGPSRDRRLLRDGQRVAFNVVNSDKGPQAEDVEALS